MRARLAELFAVVGLVRVPNVDALFCYMWECGCWSADKLLTSGIVEGNNGRIC